MASFYTVDHSVLDTSPGWFPEGAGCCPEKNNQVRYILCFKENIIDQNINTACTSQ